MRTPAVLLAALGAVTAKAAGPATLALWPQHLDEKLSLSHDADGFLSVESSRGGALGTFDVKLEADLELPFDPLVESMEVAWVPASEMQSSTFDHVFASSPRFCVANAVGIHLQVKLRSEVPSWAVVNETDQDRIEANVRDLLKSALPALEILPILSRGFLAKTLCDFHAWETSDPLQELLDVSSSPSQSLCYSSSFPFPTTYQPGAPLSKLEPRDSDYSAVERMLLSAEQTLSEKHTKQRRLAVVSLVRTDHTSTSALAEYLEVWISAPNLGQEAWQVNLPSDSSTNNLLFATSIVQNSAEDKLEYFWAPQISPDSANSLTFQARKAGVVASVSPQVTGEGFHRRIELDIELLEPGVCGVEPEDKTILVRVPISSTAYVDLDEIRRMERFGQLRLLTFAKHIEIERPSPISSQHVIGLAFVMPAGVNALHAEFPIHFRYQAPSETDLYREASIVAPEAFLFCPTGIQTITKRDQASEDEGVLKYIQTWGLSDMPNAAEKSRSGGWLRLSPQFPVAVQDVLTPVGYLPSDSLVSAITLSFASMGAVLLVWISTATAKQPSNPSGHASPNWKAK